jgi:hypothetical protein
LEIAEYNRADLKEPASQFAGSFRSFYRFLPFFLYKPASSQTFSQATAKKLEFSVN